MKCWTKIPLLLLMILCSFDGLGQSIKNAKELDILIVPFNRFNFHTEYKISEIAEINQIESNEVYNAYLGTLLKELIYSDTNLRFKTVDESDLQFFMKNVSYKFDAKKGYTYCDINSIAESEWSNIIDYYEVDAILFLTVYRIRATMKSMSGGQSGRMQFSRHFLDYELRSFDKSRSDVYGTFEFPISLSGTSLSTKGLRLQFLAEASREFIVHMNQQRTEASDKSRKSKR